MISCRADLFKSLYPRTLQVGDRVFLNKDVMKDLGLTVEYAINTGTILWIGDIIGYKEKAAKVKWDNPVGTSDNASNFGLSKLERAPEKRADLFRNLPPKSIEPGDRVVVKQDVIDGFGPMGQASYVDNVGTVIKVYRDFGLSLMVSIEWDKPVGANALDANQLSSVPLKWVEPAMSRKADLFKHLPKQERRPEDRIELYVKFFYEADRHRLQYNGLVETEKSMAGSETDQKKVALNQLVREECMALGFTNDSPSIGFGSGVLTLPIRAEGMPLVMDFVQRIKIMLSLPATMKKYNISEVGQVVHATNSTILFMVVL